MATFYSNDCVQEPTTFRPRIEPPATSASAENAIEFKQNNPAEGDPDDYDHIYKAYRPMEKCTTASLRKTSATVSSR